MSERVGVWKRRRTPYWLHIERSFKRTRDREFVHRPTLPRVTIQEKNVGVPEDDADDRGHSAA